MELEKAKRIFHAWRKKGSPAIMTREEHQARAEMRRAGELEARKKGAPTHIKTIDFIPSRFVLQTHGWGKELKFRNFSDGKRMLKAHPMVERHDSIFGGKWHYDIRVQEAKALTWFGFALFSNPYLVTTTRHAKGAPKGIARLVSQEPVVEAKNSKGGKPKMESLGDINWMDYEGFLKPEDPGAPHVKGAYMFIMDKGLAVKHRRSYDHVDVTFLGKRFKGRYLFRQIHAGRWTFVRFSDDHQFDINLMKQVATGKRKVPEIKAPGGQRALSEVL